MTASIASAPCDPAPLDAFLPPAPVLAGEDAAACASLRQHMLDDLTPEGAIEAIWTDEIISLTWQRRQYAHLRAHILAQARSGVLWSVLGAHLKFASSAFKRMTLLLDREERRDPDAVAHVGKLLAQKGLDRATVAVRAHRHALAELAQIETLTAALERRRERLLREVERHQAFAARVRATMRQYERMPTRPGEDERLGRPPSAAEIARDLKGRSH
jgi:hypothetical protein